MLPCVEKLICGHFLNTQWVKSSLTVLSHCLCGHTFLSLLMLACCCVFRNWSIAASLMFSERNHCRCSHTVCLYIYVPGDVGVLPCVQKLIHGCFLNVLWVKSLLMLSHCLSTHVCLSWPALCPETAAAALPVHGGAEGQRHPQSQSPRQDHHGYDRWDSLFSRLVSSFNILKTDTFSACWVILVFP